MNFNTTRAAAAAGLSERQVRGYVKAGLLAPARGPRGAFRFSFRDVVVLRTGKSLNDAGIPTRRVRRVMARLHDQRPPVSLSAVRIKAHGPQLVVDDAAGSWEPVTGQLHLPFEVHLHAESPTDSIRVEATTDESKAALGACREGDWWFEEGLRLEETDPLGARAAYREAIAQEPGHASAHANLGRLLHEEGSFGAAEDHYRQALLAEPGSSTAAFNLGVVLEDLGNHDGALAAYLQSLDADPSLSAAHFNAGRLLETKGQRAEALGHFVAYRRMEEGR